MKPVDMTGVCWGPYTSAGIHGTSKCSAHELYHLPDFGCHWLDTYGLGFFWHDEKISSFKFVTTAYAMLYASTGYGTDWAFSYGCIFFFSSKE